MFGKLWARIRRSFGRAFRREPEPGRFESGIEVSSLHGIPRAPRLWSAEPRIPGLRSQGTLGLAARAAGRAVPRLQADAGGVRARDAHHRTGGPRRGSSCCCRGRRRPPIRGGAGTGSTRARCAATARRPSSPRRSARVRRRYRCHRKRVLVAGMSAGGALAAVIGVRYPGLVAAVAVHSGMACGAAKSPLSAIAVMQARPGAGCGGDRRCRPRRGASARIADSAARGPRRIRPVVSPRNAAALVRQYLHLNGHAVDARRRCDVAGLARRRQPKSRRRWRAAARRSSANGAARAGWSRAWSRCRDWATHGAAAMPRWRTTTREPPDATALVGAFFADALS